MKRVMTIISLFTVVSGLRAPLFTEFHEGEIVRTRQELHEAQRVLGEARSIEELRTAERTVAEKRKNLLEAQSQKKEAQGPAIETEGLVPPVIKQALVSIANEGRVTIAMLAHIRPSDLLQSPTIESLTDILATVYTAPLDKVLLSRVQEAARLALIQTEQPGFTARQSLLVLRVRLAQIKAVAAVRQGIMEIEQKDLLTRAMEAITIQMKKSTVSLATFEQALAYRT